MDTTNKALAEEIVELRRIVDGLVQGSQLRYSTTRIGDQDVAVTSALESGVAAEGAIPGLTEGVGTATSDAADAKQAAVDAQAAADAAQEAAEAASRRAQGAQESADGKNTITYRATAPTSDTPGTAVGDVWFVRSPSLGAITAQYEWTGPTNGWAERKIDGLLIANIDAGSITTGTLTGLTILGSRIKTAETGQRIDLNGSRMNFYDAQNRLGGAILGYTAGSQAGGGPCVAIETSSGTQILFGSTLVDPTTLTGGTVDLRAGAAYIAQTKADGVTTSALYDTRAPGSGSANVRPNLLDRIDDKIGASLMLKGAPNAQAYSGTGWLLLNAALANSVIDSDVYSRSGGAFTVKRDGTYIVSAAAAMYSAGIDRTNRALQITVNSTTIDGTGTAVKVEQAGLGVSVSRPVQLKAGDVVRVYFNAAPASGNVCQNAGDTMLAITRISPISA